MTKLISIKNLSFSQNGCVVMQSIEYSTCDCQQTDVIQHIAIQNWLDIDFI